MYILGKLFEWLGFPALVCPFRYYNGVTGQVIEVITSPFYTKLIVGDKEFFFIRETGKYDGFGAMSVEKAEPIADCRLADTPKLADVP